MSLASQLYPFISMLYSKLYTCEGLIAIMVILFPIIVLWIYQKRKSIIRALFGVALLLPPVRRRIERELEKAGKMMRESFNPPERCQSLPSYRTLPAQGLSREEILGSLEKYASLRKYKWEEGRVSGAVYAGDATVGDLCTEVYHRTVWSNPLHPDMFADVRRMEAEVVRMCCDLFNGDADSCGAMTSGGTESIVLACKAYRDRAHARGIDQPEIVVPITAHAAFEKAAQLMDCRIRYVPVDEQTRAVTVRAMRRAITKNTCLIMGSAPCFPYGTIDPIAQLSQLALKCRVPLHVDCCLGGFLVPFAQRAGFKLDPKRPCEGPAQPIGFELPGVTSISCDPHKYGFTPKGSSVVLYRSNELRNYQYFTCTDWPGGIYASPTLAGSRSGALIATCWATMLHHGVDKYVKATREILNTAKYLEEEIRKMPALQILGRVDAMVVAFTAAPSPTNRRKPRFNIYVLKELMEKRGWSLNALQFPPGVHVAVTALSVKPGVAQQLIADLKAVLTELETRTDIKEGDYAAFYGSTQQIPDRSLVSRLCGLFLDACYSLEDR